MKNLKLISFLLLLLFIPSKLNAQFGGTCPSKVLKSRFLNSTVLVISTGSEEMDKRLKKGFDKYWTITDYEFVDQDYKYDEKDHSISYLIPVTMTVEDQMSTQEYNRYALVMGGGEDLFFRTVADVVLDNFSHEKYVTDAAYRATGIVKMMHDFIEMKVNGEKVNGETIVKVRYNTGLIYNKRSTEIRKKTLLISESNMQYGQYFPFETGGRTLFEKEKFEEIYQGKVKFVSDEELQTYIDSNEEGYCYLLPVFTRKAYLFVIDCESERVLYNGYKTSGLRISKGDIKALNKAILK